MVTPVEAAFTLGEEDCRLSGTIKKLHCTECGKTVLHSTGIKKEGGEEVKSCISCGKTTIIE